MCVYRLTRLCCCAYAADAATSGLVPCCLSSTTCGLSIHFISPQLPLTILRSSTGHPVLVELKNGDTYSGVLVSIDSWMNLNLADAVRTSAEGDAFWSVPKVYIRGNTVKYVCREGGAVGGSSGVPRAMRVHALVTVGGPSLWPLTGVGVVRGPGGLLGSLIFWHLFVHALGLFLTARCVLSSVVITIALLHLAGRSLLASFQIRSRSGRDC